MSRTKAHCYVPTMISGCGIREIIQYLEAGATVEIHGYDVNYGAEDPACLLSPTTCDRVREFMEIVAKEWPTTLLGSKAAELLKLLPEEE